MNNYMRLDGHKFTVSPSEDEFMAVMDDFPNISAFGNMKAEAIGELIPAWQAYKESIRKNEKNEKAEIWSKIYEIWDNARNLAWSLQGAESPRDMISYAQDINNQLDKMDDEFTKLRLLGENN